MFQIIPKDVIIPPKESCLYECRFSPNHLDRFFWLISTACVYNVETSIPTLPFDVNLRLFGHAFPENKTWIPQVQIEPQPVVVLPCSVPLEPTYTTFLLRSVGVLPTAFKFIAPTKSQVVPNCNYPSGTISRCFVGTSC